MCGSLRISTQAQPDPAPRLGKRGADTDMLSRSSIGDQNDPSIPSPGNADDYLRRLVLLIPAEVITLYLTFRPMLELYEAEWAASCLVLVFVARAFGTKQKGKPVQWAAVLVACISFFLWVLAMGHEFWLIDIPEGKGAQGIVSAAIGVWTFLIPFIYRPK